MTPIARAREAWALHIGEVEYGRIGKRLQSALATHGTEQVCQAIEQYALRNQGRAKKVEWFAESIREYLPQPKVELVDPLTGDLTPAGYAIHPRTPIRR
jgi:hypothetical protein